MGLGMGWDGGWGGVLVAFVINAGTLGKGRVGVAPYSVKGVMPVCFPVFTLAAGLPWRL